MFRELTRKSKEIPAEQCTRILCEEKRGVLSVLGDDGYPYGMPMNHVYDEESGCLWFHCGRQESHRADAIRRCDKVSFCVTDSGRRREGEWALDFCSVIVFGRAEILDDPARIKEISEKLCRKFTDDEAYIRREIEAFAHETWLIRLTPEHICGKRITES